MTAWNVPEEGLSCDVEMEAFGREAPRLSTPGPSWDSENPEGRLRRSALTQEEPGAREAAPEHPGFGKHLSVSADLPQCQRVPATNGFRVRGSDVKSLDCDPASHAGQKSYAAKRAGDGLLWESFQPFHGSDSVWKNSDPREAL